MNKPILLLLYIAFASLKAFAQIPNSSFENWVTVGTVQNPVFWSSLNGTTISGTAVTCAKVSPGLPGNYHIELTSTKDSLSGFIVPGIAVCGTFNKTHLKLDTIQVGGSPVVILDSNSIKPITGFPFTGRPAYLTGVYEYMTFESSGNAPGYIDIQLTRWNASSHTREKVASTRNILTGMTMVWTRFSIPLNYLSNAIPDTCTLVFSASGTPPTEGDYLHFDGLSFSDTALSITGINENITVGNFILYPNPASANEITITNYSINQNNSILEIYDLVGTLIKQEIIKQQQQKVNIEGLSNGCYIIVIKNNESVISKRFIVKR